MTDSVFTATSFMAAPGEVADWRLVLLYDAACATGLADLLPATVDEAATSGGLEPVAVRAVLDALVAGGSPPATHAERWRWSTTPATPGFEPNCASTPAPSGAGPVPSSRACAGRRPPCGLRST